MRKITELDIWKKITNWIRNCLMITRAWIDSKIILPFYKTMAAFFSERFERKKGIRKESIHGWKQKALDDFMIWLSDIPDSPLPGDAATIDSCDLFTLLNEFMKLRQEIRLQNREQGRTLKNLENIRKTCGDVAEIFKARTANLEELEYRIRRDTEKRVITSFFDLRDALKRGLDAGKQLQSSGGFFRSAPKGTEGVIEGYEMAIRRFDRAVGISEIEPLDPVGQPFDSRIMKAVETRSVPGMEVNHVVEVRTCGFIRGDEVLRSAEVVVCK